MQDYGDTGMQEVGKQGCSRGESQPLRRTTGHGDAGGGQTEHPGGGQVRGWSGGGELATHTRILVLGQSNRPRPVP